MMSNFSGGLARLDSGGLDKVLASYPVCCLENKVPIARYNF